MSIVIRPSKKKAQRKKGPTVQVIGPLPRPKKKKSKKAKRAKNPFRPTSGAVAQYRLGLRDPFDPRVDGVRMIDTYSYPTVPQKIKTRLSLTSDASGNLGFIVLPTPFYCLEMNAGTQSGATPFTNNATSSYLTTPTLAATSGLGSYRVVASGFRLLLSDTVTNAKGIYTIAPVPIARNTQADWNFMNTVPYTASTTKPVYYMGIPQPNAAVEALPHARTFNAQDLQYRGDCMCVAVPYDAAVKDFKATGTRTISAYDNTNPLYANTITGSLVMASNAGVVTNAGNKDLLDMVGNLAFVVYATGLPVSTQEISLELVYHLEYIATPVAAVNGISVGAPSPSGTTSLLESTFMAVKDNMYLGRTAMNLGLNLGMAGLRYASQRNRRAIELD